MREYVKIPLRTDEYRALEQLADAELRPVPMQAHHIILEVLRQRCLLQSPEAVAVRDVAPEVVSR